MTTDQPRRGDTITTAAQLDALWDMQDVLIEATGSYSNGQGTFSECWARPVPEFVGGTPGTWEVLVFGSTPPASLVTSERITRATVLYVPGEQPPSVEDARADATQIAADHFFDGTECGHPACPEGAYAEWDEQYVRYAVHLIHVAEVALAASRAVSERTVLTDEPHDLAVDEHSPCHSTATTEDAAHSLTREQIVDAVGHDGEWCPFVLADGSCCDAGRIADSVIRLLATARPDTTREWGVRDPAGSVTRCQSEAEATRPDYFGWTVVRREVTAWTEATK